MPYVINLQRNFRWDYIQNEYLVRFRLDDEEDWFVLQKPKPAKNGLKITNEVVCPHLSTLLKTKNLYLVFDDENGIGTIQQLAALALTNTGWTLGECDTLYERDGTTEKIRSLKSDGKKGSYQLITDICNLFKAYPVYHGDTKTVDIHALNNKRPMGEMYVGKNLKGVTVEPSSESIITRLYVEGEYGEDGYIGIDDVNPTGLTYLLNFDYYKSIGLFTAAHQTAYDTYMTEITAKVAAIKAQSRAIATAQNRLNQLWGQVNYVIYVLSGGTVTQTITGGTVRDEQKEFIEGDLLYVFKATGNYREVTVGAGGSVTFEGDDVYAAKFVTILPSGLIGSRQVSIEAKEKLIASLQREYDVTVDPVKKQNILDQIAGVRTSITEIYNGTEEAAGLYDLMREAVELAISLNGMLNTLATLQEEQLQIEATFYDAMGDMLRDGYWSDNNYALGQEEYLYEDAIDVMEQMSKPTVKYTLSQVALSEQMGFEETLPEINANIRVWDTELKLNDVVYVSKRTRNIDRPDRDSVEVTNEDMTLSAQSFESIMTRISALADLVNQKNTLYERAGAINANGSIYIDRLNGAIDVLKNKLSSVVSNWYTDDSGALIFENVMGTSAMMLTGDGFMIANGKTPDGTDWNWRTKPTIGSRRSDTE